MLSPDQTNVPKQQQRLCRGSQAVFSTRVSSSGISDCGPAAPSSLHSENQIRNCRRLSRRVTDASTFLLPKLVEHFVTLSKGRAT
jgi:hypothetical protein